MAGIKFFKLSPTVMFRWTPCSLHFLLVINYFQSGFTQETSFFIILFCEKSFYSVHPLCTSYSVGVGRGGINRVDLRWGRWGKCGFKGGGGRLDFVTIFCLKCIWLVFYNDNVPEYLFPLCFVKNIYFKSFHGNNQFSVGFVKL